MDKGKVLKPPKMPVILDLKWKYYKKVNGKLIKKSKKELETDGG